MVYNVSTSWIDHIVCSKLLDDCISTITVHYDFVTSDDKPLSVKLTDMGVQLCVDDLTKACYSSVKYDWSKISIPHYKSAVHAGLAHVNIPQCLLGCDCLCNKGDHLAAIDKCCADITTCIKECTDACVPTLNNCATKYNVPGLNDVVKEKHAAACAAYLDWVIDGKPRSGYLHKAMVSTRVAFKFALRHCKAAEEQLKADARAKQLACKHNLKAFWKSIARDSCKRVSASVNKVGEAVGTSEICKMWQMQFSNLYNSLDVARSKQDFLSKITSDVDSVHRCITVNEVSVALRHQKKDKSAGPNGIYMESLIFACTCTFESFLHLLS